MLPEELTEYLSITGEAVASQEESPSIEELQGNENAMVQHSG